MNYIHSPVLLNETLELLNLSPGKTVIDGTIGLAGHSTEIVKKITPKGRLIGIDLDRSALETAKGNLSKTQTKTNLVNDNFANISYILSKLNIKSVDAILLDLGFSSYQIENKERGFSFQSESPLDMRMSQENPVTAADIINNTSQDKLADILYQYGEERHSRKIAKYIVQTRKDHPIKTTDHLVKVIKKAYPQRYTKIHPATRTFQALRITVNKELESLSKLLQSADKYLGSGGRLAIISFHSLEDRLVKQNFLANKKKGIFKVITKKPVMATEAEISNNRRSRSAKLRVAEKIRISGL